MGWQQSRHRSLQYCHRLLVADARKTSQKLSQRLASGQVVK